MTSEMLTLVNDTQCIDMMNMFMTVQNASLDAIDDVDNVQQRTHYLTQANFTTTDVPCGGMFANDVSVDC